MQSTEPKRLSPYNIYIQEGFKASRFVVDLNEGPGPDLEKNAGAGGKIKDYLYDFLNRTERTSPERIEKEPLADRFVLSLRRFAGYSGRIIYRTFRHIGFLIASPFRLFIRRNPAPAEEQLLFSAQPQTAEPPSVSTGRLKKFLSFLLFPLALAVLALPIKAYTYYRSLDEVRGRVAGSSISAIERLLSAAHTAEALDFQAAGDNFSAAGKTFSEARRELEAVNDLLFKLAALAPDKQAKLAASSKAILSAGEAAASLGKNLSLAVAALSGRRNGELTDALDDFSNHAREAVGAAGDLDAALRQVDVAAIPDEYRERFRAMKDNAGNLTGSLADFTDLVDKINLGLGRSDLKRYLVVFQNNTEARATGGFLGSYALVDFHRGKVKNLEVPGGGTYDTEAGLRERVIAPRPLWLVNPLWHLWDANWWPDWPASARKIAWFYEKSNGPTVDGVISLTPDVLARLLAITGPIDLLKDYGATVTSDNFLEILQAQAEQKPEVTKEPKRIIGDLLEKIMAELPAKLDQAGLFKLLEATEASLDEKQILLYFKDNELESTVARYGWDGRVRDSSRDYLMVVNSNIGGGKSDKRVAERIDHRAEIDAGGGIVDTLTITRVHAGDKGENWSGVRNVNWLRIYVPQGSELLAAGGFTPPDAKYLSEPEDSWLADDDLRAEENAAVDEKSGTRIYDEAGKTVFANWSMIDPGQSARIVIKYRLPFRLAAAPERTVGEKLSALFAGQAENYQAYSLLAQKQSGSAGSEFSSAVTLASDSPFDSRPVWRYPQEEAAGENNELWDVKTSLAADRYWAVLLRNK